jgi:hypothetical protein
VQSLAGKFSAKVQVDLSKEDKQNLAALGSTDVLHNKPMLSLQQTKPSDYVRKKQTAQCTAANDDNKSAYQSLPCQTHQRSQQGHLVNVPSGVGWTVANEESPQCFNEGSLQPVADSPQQNVLVVRGSPKQEDSVLRVEERKRLPETAPNQQFSTPTPNLPHTQCCSQLTSNSCQTVPTQESCNSEEVMFSNNRYVGSENNERLSEFDAQQSYMTSYQYLNCSPRIRCQICNQVKDHVRLYSYLPQNGLASPTSIHNCMSFPISSGPEAMSFSFSLCWDCSNNMASSNSPMRQNSFCGTNETVHSSCLFPQELMMPPSILTQTVPPMYASNLEKGVNPQQERDAMPRHQSSPSRLNHLNSHPNFGGQEFRDEILHMDHRMRQSPSFHRNIPVNSSGSQQSNTGTAVKAQSAMKSSKCVFLIEFIFNLK